MTPPPTTPIRIRPNPEMPALDIADCINETCPWSGALPLGKPRNDGLVVPYAFGPVSSSLTCEQQPAIPAVTGYRSGYNLERQRARLK